MLRPTPCALLLTIALAACGGGGDTANPPAPSPLPSIPRVTPGTWVIMGSSSAAGQGASSGQSWAQRLGAVTSTAGVTVINIARGGALTPMARPLAAPAPGRPAPDPGVNVDAALALQPKLLLLSFPTNDSAAGYPASETLEHLRAIRQAASQSGVSTLVLGVQPRNAFDAGQRATLKAIDSGLSQEAGPCFVPLFAALATAQGDIQPQYSAGDGVHLNDAGHAMVLAQVRAALDAARCVRLN